MTMVDDQMVEYENTPGIGNEYYWIVAKHPNSGKLIILGAYETEEKAYGEGFARIEGEFKVVSLPTRNTARASQILKYRAWKETANLNYTVDRAMHKTEVKQ